MPSSGRKPSQDEGGYEEDFYGEDSLIEAPESLRESGNWKNALWADSFREFQEGKGGVGTVRAARLADGEDAPRGLDPNENPGAVQFKEGCVARCIEPGQTILVGETATFHFQLYGSGKKADTVRLVLMLFTLDPSKKEPGLEWKAKEVGLKPGETQLLTLDIKTDSTTSAGLWEYGLYLEPRGEKRGQLRAGVDFNLNLLTEWEDEDDYY